LYQRSLPLGVVFAVPLFVLALSCTERPGVTAPEGGDGVTPTSALPLALACSADVRAAQLSCEPTQSGAVLFGANTKIIGGQNDYVRLYAPPQTVTYDSLTEVFRAQVFLTNKTWVTFGTPDGVTATGVRVFFHEGPQPSTVTVSNPDGTDTFTGTGQPYFDFGGTLGSFASSNNWWEWHVPSTVSSFSFTVYIQADVEHPHGWIEVTPHPAGTVAGNSIQLYAKVLGWHGREVAETVHWSSTDAGKATVNPTGWVTGVTGGVVDIVAATFAGQPPAAGRVTVFDNSGYDVELRYEAGFTPAQKQAIEAAVTRWETLIAGNLASHKVVLTAGPCPATNEWVDDLLLYFTVVPDRPDVQATAEDCRFRAKTGQAGDSLPSAAIIEFDDADLAAAEAAGNLELLALQQIAHALGIGSVLWDQYGLRSGAGTGDPLFVGSAAIAEFNAAAGTEYPGDPVPLENSGMDAEGNWRAAVFGCELLSAWCQITPVSAITLGSLEDLGYQVDYGAADAFTLPGL